MNKLHKKSILAILVLFASCSLYSCKEQEMSGKMTITFSSTFSGTKIVPSDGKLYNIPSGESITIEDIQYFISKLTLIEQSGKRVEVMPSSSNYHYIDMGDKSTTTWNIENKIPNGNYTAVEFIFGFNESDNKSNRFLNPPLNSMFWPDALGGGYHYMKINGKWLNPSSDTLHPYGLHAGIGQKWENEYATEFYHNHSSVKQDSMAFFVISDGLVSLKINMEVSNWFSDPNLWSFKTFGGAIMQNQQAQQALKENAWNVFTVSI